MLITDQLIEACREAGPSQERLFYKAWSNQAIYSFNRVNRTRGLELAHQIHDYAYQHDSKVRPLHVHVCSGHYVVEPTPLRTG